jgi:hydroxymethylbilane synthase
MSSFNKMHETSVLLPVAARSSPLSRIQVEEILTLLRRHRPEVSFVFHPLSSAGDRDQKTSLRTLEKTNFFTDEIDLAVLNSACRLGIHSAKDLPTPLPEGLTLVCLTDSIDSSDSLVFREGQSFERLPTDAMIATSSIRREHMVEELYRTLLQPKKISTEKLPFRFVDLRGTIHQRLEKLDSGEVDGVVIAEAALIRLGLTHLNRIKLPGEGAEGQGQLAVLARKEDQDMRELFQIPGNKLHR